MSIYVRIYANSNDGYSRSTSTTAIAGGITDNSGTTLKFGADVDDATCGQAFLAFDTSAIASPSTVSITLNKVVRSHAGTSGSSTYQPRYYNWTDPITTSTFRTNTQWTALTAAGTISLNLNDTPTSYSGSFNVLSGWNNATTSTKIALNTATNALTGAGWVAASADTSGTTDDPYLTAAPTGAWTIVGVSSLPTPGTTLTLTEPAGVADGDLLIACIASRSTATTAPTITGWTAVGSQNNNNTLTTGSAIASGAMLYQIRSGTPTLAVTIPAGISVAMGQIVAYRGSAITPFPFAAITPTSDAYGITPTNATYSVVREATTATTASPASAHAGQGFSGGLYTCRQYFLTLNTSTIPADVTSAILSINVTTGFSGDTLEVRQVSSAANMIAGSSLGAAGPLLGSIAMGSSAARLSISLDITSMTRGSAVVLCLHSSKQRLNTAPTSTETQIISVLADAANLRAFVASTAATAVTAAAGTAVSVAGLTTTQDDDLIVAMCAGGQEAAWSAFNNVTTPIGASGATDTTTAPSTTGWIERADNVTTTGADTSLGIFDAVRTSTGATGNLTVTASVSAGHVVIAGAFRMPLADAWNINDKSASVTLSALDKTATTTSGANAGVRSTKTYASGTAGKYYAEQLYVTTLANAVGIAPTSNVLDATTLTMYVSGSASGNILVNSTLVGTLGAYAAGDVLGIAWDAGARLIWFRLNAGDWNGSGSADPATGTGGFDTSFAASTPHALWARFASGSSGDKSTIRTELAEYTQAVPTGFKSWMGETPPTADAWNKDDLALGTLSNNDKTLTSPSSGTASRSTTTHTNAVAGKYYAEAFTGTLASGQALFGIKNRSATITDITDAAYINAISGNTNVIAVGGPSLGAFAAGDIICVAWDAGAERIWFRKNAGNWNNNATYDPATGVGGISAATLTNAVEFGLWGSLGEGGYDLTIRTEAAEFTQPTPTGFLSWMGESLTADPNVTVNVTGVGVTAEVGTLTVTAATSATASVANPAALTVDVGTLTVSTPIYANVSNPAALTVSAGDLSIAAKANASVSNPALLTVSAGDLSIAAKANASVSNPALLTVSAGDVSVAAKANASVANPAALTVSAGTLDVTAKRNVSASVANPAALTVDVGTLTVTTATVVNVTASVSNPAALAVSAGDLSVSISKIASLTNPALLTVSAGTLDITAKQNITASVSNPAALAVSAGTLTVSTAGNVTASVSNPALLTVSAGDLSIAAKAGASVANPALLTVSAGTLSVAAKAGASVANPALLTVSAGTLSVAANASASVSNPALLTASAGTVTVTAKENITASVSNPAALTVSVGTLSVAAGGSISVPLTGVEVIASAGTITITSHEDVTLTGVGVTVSVGTVTVETPAVVGGDVARVGAGFMLEMAHWMG